MIKVNTTRVDRHEWTDVKNNNRKLILSPFQSSKQRHYIHWVPQKRFLKRDIELLVAIHDVLAPVVQTSDSAIHRINNYPADSVIDFRNTYPLDSDLSGG